MKCRDILKNFLNLFKKKEAPSSLENQKKKFSWGKLFSFSKLDDRYFQEMEEKLIESDTGGSVSLSIIETFRKRIKEEKIKESREARDILKGIIKNYFKMTELSLSDDRLNVFVIIGVNGVGKTTTISKLAHYYSKQNKKKIILGAADTFRAAAKEQLEEWGRRLDLPVIGQPAGSDAASVAYDTVHSALAKGSEIAVIDTAGRLHNKANLVEQLDKLERVIDKFKDRIVKKTFLILDATLGQSGFEQAKIFKEKPGVDGIIITKLDTEARGGVLISISEKLKLPVWFISYGEKMDDFSPFLVEEYLNSIL